MARAMSYDTTGTVKDDEISSEQAQDLAYLAAAAADEPALPGQEPEQDTVPAVTPAESLAGAIQIAGMVAGVAGFPSVAEVWNQNAARGFSEKAVPVLSKYAWGGRILDFLGNGAGVEELALLMYAGPLVLATAAAARKDAAAKAEKSSSSGEHVSSGEPVASVPFVPMAEVNGNA